MGITLFVALQCFECSTMQVKQKKKSSNKWVCVICNQKQSVGKVFALGYKAKELRLFVQSFNMSRKVADEEAQAIADSFPEVDVDGDIDEEVSDVRGKKRSDWSEYLDFDSPNDDQRLRGEEENKNILMLQKSHHLLGEVGRKTVMNSSSLPSPDAASKAIFRTDGIISKKDTEPRNLESEKVTKPGSKWDAYLIDDEGVSQKHTI